MHNLDDGEIVVHTELYVMQGTLFDIKGFD